MVSPPPLLLLLLLPPLILLQCSSMINFCNARQLGLCHKGLCKMKSSSAGLQKKQEKCLPVEVSMDHRVACIEQQADFGENEKVRGSTSDALSGANTMRSLYTVSSGTTRYKAKEHESAEFHLDYVGPEIHPPSHN